jgi:hypothetical protein
MKKHYVCKANGCKLDRTLPVRFVGHCKLREVCFQQELIDDIFGEQNKEEV